MKKEPVVSGALAEAMRLYGKPLLGKFTRSDAEAVYALDSEGNERPVGCWKPRQRCASAQEIVVLEKKDGFWLMHYSMGGKEILQ